MHGAKKPGWNVYHLRSRVLLEHDMSRKGECDYSGRWVVPGVRADAAGQVNTGPSGNN